MDKPAEQDHGRASQRAGDATVTATADWTDDARLTVLSRLLNRVRLAFGMDVVFVSQFQEGRRFFRHVDADSRAADIVKVGGSDPLEESYCQRVVDGRLPEAIPDAQQSPEALQIAATKSVGIGAHLSVPILLSSGEVFGTLCCFSRRPHPDLSTQDAVALRSLAKIVARTINARSRGSP